MIPPWETLQEMRFQLTYTHHGGSGTSLTLEDVDGMTIEEMHWWYKRLGEQRKSEAAAIKRANQRSR